MALLKLITMAATPPPAAGSDQDLDLEMEHSVQAMATEDESLAALSDEYEDDEEPESEPLSEMATLDAEIREAVLQNAEAQWDRTRAYATNSILRFAAGSWQGEPVKVFYEAKADDPAGAKAADRKGSVQSLQLTGKVLSLDKDSALSSYKSPPLADGGAAGGEASKSAVRCAQQSCKLAFALISEQ